MSDSVRDIFEKVKTKSVAAAEYAGKKAGDAGRKAGELWEITRLKMQIYDLNVELNTLYKQMGELLYAAHVDPETNTEPIDLMLEKVEGKLAEIETRRQKIRMLRKSGQCPNPECGKPIEKNDTFCRTCGAVVMQEEDE